jgi:CRISPR/Cas system CSM-associated protein Csm3 (group 7 of RAMP superfamily)
LGVLRGRLVVQTPLHVWSGQIGLTGRNDLPLVKSHVMIAGRPVVPGSSFKGAVRSIVEAITRSCVRITRAQRRQLPGGADGCRKRDALCLACRMFGALDFQGHIRFSDATLGSGWALTIVEIPALYGPRSREQLYYQDNEQVVGRKFYQHGRPAYGDTPLEACPVNAELDFTLYFDNLTPGELGVLLVALGQGDGQWFPRLWPKLGGGKPVCYGSVEIQVDELRVEEAGAAAYATYDAPPPLSAAGWSIYLQAASELILSEQLHKLASILQPETDRDCPDRNY